MIGLEHCQSFFPLWSYLLFLFFFFSFRYSSYVIFTRTHHFNSFYGLLLLSPSSSFFSVLFPFSISKRNLGGKRTKTAVSQNQQRKQPSNSGALYPLTYWVQNREISLGCLVSACTCREHHALWRMFIQVLLVCSHMCDTNNLERLQIRSSRRYFCKC